MVVRQSLKNIALVSRFPPPRLIWTTRANRVAGQTQLKKRGLDKLLEEVKADESGFDDSPLTSGIRRK